MSINIPKNIIDMVHRYTFSFSTSTSTLTSTTIDCSAVCVSLFSSKGLRQLIIARYEMLDASYPVLSPEEVSVRDHLKAYIRSYTQTI